MATNRLANRTRQTLAWITSRGKRFRNWYVDYRFGSIDENAQLGRRGEQAAAQLLRRKGLNVIAESESDRAGEIDLIALRKRPRLIVFVEVKTLSTTRPGHPADRVDENKQARITRAALRYLKRKKLLGIACRFDVVAVWWPRDEPRPTRVEHYESAFDAVGIDSFYG
ncbi:MULTISPECIES: YraN family protein [Rhodopirellula]|uniref:YraN family protein n=1 Tax=Rhodopirellula TaxID=265488 RepID=UPI00257EAA1B|nr:YraN family protein [Rhodopirellula sp. UBA1907]